MAYFTATSTNGQAVIINGNSVTKVVDFSTYRTIYFGNENYNHQVKDTLSIILSRLKP